MFHWGSVALIEPIITAEPPPRASMCGIASRVVRTAERKFAVDAAGAVYVIDSESKRAEMLTAGATSPTVLPFAGLTTPGDVAVDEQGNVYVYDVLNFRVLKLPVL
jgi:hypothetical protein